MKKISRRDFLKVTGLSAAALGLSACGGSASSTAASSTAAAPAASTAASAAAASGSFNLDNIQSRNLIAWERMGSAHIMGRTQAAFCDKLEELSQGKITTTRFLDGELESGGTVKDQFESGIFQCARYTLEMSTYYGFEEGTVFGLPFLFKDRDHFWRYAESDVGKQILDDLTAADQGLIALGYIEEGARHFFTTKGHPMTSYKDMAGLKMRVQTSDIYVGLVEAFGASATPMAWTEIYTALSTGVVDGAENPYSGYQSYMLNEVAPYIYEDGHIFAGGVLAFSKPVWNEMNEDEHELVREAAAYACDLNHKMNETDEADIKADLTAKGVTITTPTDQEKSEMFDLCKGLYDTFGSDWTDLVAQIQAI